MANQWVLKEDGYLNINVNVKNIVYHPILNVLLVITTANEVKVLDINSGVILKSSHLSTDGHSVICHYLGELDKIVFYDGMTLGVRSDYNGVLLLDTILQTPVQVSNEIIKLELLVSEAVLFLQSLQNLDELGLDNTSEIINELLVKISNVQNNSKKGIKAQKWNTICLELPASSLKMVANNVMLQLKRLDKHIPTLPIASAINERLTNLMSSDMGFENDPGNPQRYLMYSEAARRKTFEQWPHMDYKWALPDQMAQAGFYHQPGSTGVDRAMCFTCDVCLVCWEKTDEPWGEHERHSPGCPFVKGEYTQNVPLSVTYATDPAVGAEGTIISNGTDVGDIICTGDAQGLVVLYNARNRLEEVDAFCLDSHPVFFETMLELKEGTMLQYRLNCLSTFKYSTGSSLLKTPPILLKAKFPEIQSILNSNDENDGNDDSDDSDLKGGVTYKKCKPIGTKCFCGITVTDSSDKTKCGINFIVSYEILCTVRKSKPITKPNANSITGGGTVSSSGSQALKMHPKITSALDKPKPIHDSDMLAKQDEFHKLMVSEKKLELQHLQQQQNNQLIQQHKQQQQQPIGSIIPITKPPLPYDEYDDDLASDSGVNATGVPVNEKVLQNTSISFDSNKLSKFIASDVKKMYKNMDYKKITSALPKKFVNHDETNTMEYHSVFTPTMSITANSTNNNNNTSNNIECFSADINRPDETHSIPVQLVKIKTFHENCYIADMIPTLDRQYIVVVIRKCVKNYYELLGGDSFTGATPGSRKATTTTTTINTTANNNNNNNDNNNSMTTESSNDSVDVQDKLTDVTKMDVDDDDDYWCFSPADTPDVVTASPNMESASVDAADILLEKSEEEEIEEHQKYTTQIQVFAVDENGFIGNAPLGTRLFDNETEPISICMLPNYMDNYNDEIVSNDDFEAIGNDNPNIMNEMNDNAFAMISANGSLNVLSLLTLDTIACRQMNDTKYVSVIYCKNLERLCTYTENGLIHFYSYHDLDNDSNDGRNNNINRNDYEKMNIATLSDAGSYTGGPNDATEPDGLYQQQQEHLLQEEFVGVANVMNDLKMQISPAPSSSNLITAGNNDNINNNMGTTSIGGNAISSSGSTGSGDGNSRGIPSTIGSNHSTQLTGMIAYKNDLTTMDLKHMYALTLFEETLTPYSAEVPACWNELVQALKQRRTQHSGTGDDTHVSKTWRLHNDATTWDEHLIGITVGKNTTIGHIDFKFTLYQQCTNAPAIQITLLKQNTTGFGYRKKAPSVGSIYSENTDSSSSVDDNVDFKIDPKQLMENPVLCSEYLNAQNAEIISGPIELSSCIDLSEQGGLVILTSPKLFKTRNRHFLIHIKTMVDPMKESQGKTRGCDWLHEMSITIRSSKNYAKLSYERLQRTSMLESNVLLENLLKIVSQPEMNARKNIALDLLLWIISIRMARYRTPKMDLSPQTKFTTSANSSIGKGGTSLYSENINVYALQKDCVKVMEIYLKEFLKSSMILGNRSTAHKCVKIVSVLADGIKNMPIERDGKLRFEECLKTAILNCFPFITQAKHAGALRWFTLLILGTTSKNSQGQIAETSIHLLFNVSKEIAKRKNRYTSLLQTRFGLHGLPFEPELFDSELALSTKYNVTPSTLTSILKNATNSMSTNTVFDLKKMCATGGSEIRIFPSHIRRKGISNQLRGLLEVEPLHFTCFAASEATRVENLDLLQPSHSGLNPIHLVDDIMVEPSPTLNAINKLINIGSTHSHINLSGNDGGKSNNNNKNETEVQIKFDMKNFLAAENMFYKSLKQKFAKSANAAVKEETKALTAYSALFECAMKTKMQQLPGKNMFSSTSTKPGNKHKGKYSNNKQQNADVNAKPELIYEDALPWHKILSLPPKQTLIVDRMHSGARRFITLDFGSPIMLTDLVIPACEDLVLLFINIWCIDEETDGIQLIVSSDIGFKTLVLSDLQPPPICRYMKITTTGRYGMSATRCKIPIGSFFGHVLVSEHDQYTDPLHQCITTKNVNIPMQLKALNALYEDVQCRYNLANTKLMELLDPYLNSEISNLSHMESYIKYNKENEDSNYNKIVTVYEECITFQHQLNMIQNVRQRLSVANSDSARSDDEQKKHEPTKPSSSTSKRSTKQQLSTIGVDKLRVLSECLVEIILHYIIECGNKNISSIHTLFNFHSSCQLFDTLVVNGDTNMQLATCSLLVRMCSFQIWWGEFFSSTFIRLFSSQNCEIFPQDRVFFLLSYLGRKSISMGSRGATVIDAILRTLGIMLTTMIAPIIPNHLSRTSLIGSKIDLQLVSWLLLFLSVCLDDGVDKKDQGLQRWDFMSGETDLSKSRSHSSSHSGRPFSRSFRKRFSQSKQNNYGIVEKMMQSKFSSQIEMVLKQQENLFKKTDSQLNHLQDLFFEINVKPHASASGGGGDSGGGGASGGAGGGSSSSGSKHKFISSNEMSQGGNSSSKIHHTTNIDNTNINSMNNMNMNTNSNSSNTSTSTSTSSTSQKSQSKQHLSGDQSDHPFDRALRTLKLQNTIIVIRGLITLMLEMDYTCNMDLFLLICKIIARLVSAYKPLIQLSKIITTNQLQQLLRMAVWKDQQQPWAVHAITCLLQDILNVDKNFRQNSNEDMLISDVVKDVIENVDHRMNLDYSPDDFQQFNNLLNSDGKLPSLMECEDTEMDDILEERMDSGVKAKLKRDNSSSNLAGLSAAMDTRLECGIDTNVEIYLRRVALMTSVDLFSSLTYPPIFCGISSDTLTNNNNNINNNNNNNNANNNNNNKNNNMNNQSMEFSGWPEQMALLWSGPEYNQGFATNLMLSYVFDDIFTDLSRQDSWLGLEYVLQLWLTLNGELCETSHRNMISNEATKIPFGINAVQGLITALSWHQGIKLRCWCLGIKCLTLACNPYNNLFSYRNIAVALRDNQCISLTTIDNPNFEKMLLRFYSGIDMFPASSDNRCAGPTVCELFRMLYECLMMKLEISDLSYVKKKLREMHLRVILTLVKPGGAIALQQGPLDAQIQLLNDIRVTKFEASDVEMAFNIVENIVYLTHAEIINSEKVNCQKSGEINIYSNMFGHISGPETARRYKYNTSTNDNSIILNLLKLASTLIKITIPPDYNVMNTDEEVLMDSHVANESQTDEIKAAEIKGHPEKKNRTSCLADSILKNSTITTRLFDTLSYCKHTSVVQIYSEMVNAKSGQLIPDPSNIDQAIFKFLAILKCYTSKPLFVIKPLYEFLNAASDIKNVLPRLLLSEPFLWFILYVLDSQEMVTVFTDLGGVKVLCQSLIKSNKTLINTQPGMVSLIMQYVNHKPSKHKSSSNANSQNVCGGPSIGTNVTSNAMQNNIATGSIIQSNDKKCPASSSSSFLSSAFKAPNEGLTNFAPFCSITSDNTTAQPADVLIMAPVASHRRARNAAWSYLYYATEQTIDLIITLPTAILLHEVQLQPHLPSLVACPSAVAIEISRDSSLPTIPIGNPISTGGLAIIRLKLAQPEIATNIVLRLYRPKDSASVGLTQISILGTNVFNEIKSLEPLTDDESLIAKTSLAWLRILGRCISVATFVNNNALLRKVISTAASIPGFLEACCCLLNVVPISKTKTLQNLETVILKLGLFNKELGLELIDNLLNCTLPQTFRISNDCVSDLLYELCTTFDEFTHDRIAALIRWISEMYNKPLYRSGSQYFGIYTNEQRTNPHSGFVNCLASILWTGNLKLPTEMKTLITKDIFNVIYKCSTVMQLNDPLKKATDALLCSICFIRPEMFTRLLRKMKILRSTSKSPINPSAIGNEARQEEIDDEDDDDDEEEVSVADGFGSESMTDDTKQQSTASAASINQQTNSIKLVDIKNLKITPIQLQTIAIACQSPIAIQQLIASSLPKSLATIILRYCVNCCPTLQSKSETKVGGVRCDIGGTSSSSSSSSSSSAAAAAATTPIHILTDSDKVETSRKSYGRSDPMCNIETVASILHFFTETCAEGTMRDWLGSRDGSIFWNPLLYLLCSNRISDPTSCDILCSIMLLESATIKFLSKVTACHPQNQEILTMILINAIKYSNENNGNYMMAEPSSSAAVPPKTSSKSDGVHATTSSSIQENLAPNNSNNISGFTRRLVLQLLLESERILVSITCKLPVLKRDYQMANVYHPSKRSNARQLLCYVSTHTKCREIIELSVASKTYLNATLGNITPDGVNATASILLPNESDQPGGSSSSSAPRNNEPRNNNERKILYGIRYSNLELLSVAAGVTAKDKRLKEAKNQACHKAMDLLHVLKLQKDDNFLLSASPSSVISNSSHLSALCGSIYNVMQLQHDLCKNILLTPDTTMAQILSAVRKSGHSLSTPCITLNMINNVQQKSEDEDCYENGADFDALPSPLQIFSSHGGLALLARYLPTVYPDTPKSLQQFTEKDKNINNDWVKIEQNDDIYEDVDDAPTDAAPKTPVITSVPQHSLAAFGLFLRLPAYSDILLQDKIKAQCLLRLVLGVTGDGEGNEIYNLALASSLPTLPFEVFKQLLDNTLLTSDDGIVLRRMCIEVGAIHLVLNCLGIFTHHSQVYQISEKPITQPNTPTKGSAGTNTTDEQILSDDKSHVYWAKGTGFGTGSIQQSWDVEQALLRQKSEEEHVTVLLQVLSSYINPNESLTIGDCEPTELQDNSRQFDPIPKNGDLPPLFLHLLQKSCLIPALSSYLRNDSVLDITRHIPLYRAILELLRALASSNQLVCLLSPHRKSDRTTSIASLLMNMKTCVDTYASRLKVNKKSNIKGQSQRVTVVFDDGDDEGLAFLIPDICETTGLVQNATKIDQLANTSNNSNIYNNGNNNIDDDDISIEPPIILSIEQRYLDIMKALQFDTYEMIVECENGYRFTVAHHFESVIRSAGERGHPARVKRLAQETVTLSTSLPLSYSSSVFVRCDNDRLDLMKVLITGPAETPYANGCFEFDVYFPPDYPNVPMLINLETTGRHTVRFNPNLYNDGKVCLSVLNTWHGRPEEKWNAQTSSFLQVLVSIQSLILVPEPYFNEPGFERSRGTPSGTHSSREYNSNIYQACVRWAMLEQIKNPSPCFKDIIHTHFWLKRHEICQQIEEWITDLNKPQHSERSGRAITFNSMILRRQYRQLREELAKLPIPDGLEDLNQPFSANVASPTTVQQPKDDQQLLSSAADDQTLVSTSTTTPPTTTTTTTITPSTSIKAHIHLNQFSGDDTDDDDDVCDDDKTNNNKYDLNQSPPNPKNINDTNDNDGQEGTTTTTTTATTNSMNFDVNDSTPDSELIYEIPSDIDPNDPLIIAINEI